MFLFNTNELKPPFPIVLSVMAILKINPSVVELIFAHKFRYLEKQNLGP